MGVFETENGGDTWIKRMEGMIEVLMVVTVDVDPNQPQTVYAGTSGGVYKSIDGSKIWIKVNNGLVPPDVLKSSRALSVVKDLRTTVASKTSWARKCDHHLSGA